MKIKQINTTYTIHDVFKNMKDEKHVMFLESQKDAEGLGRYSVLVCNPRLVVQSKNKSIDIDGQVTKGNPLDALEDLVERYSRQYESGLPFVSGFVGYLSYDLKNFIENLKVTVEDDIDMPDLFLGLYDGAVVYDHLDQVMYITDGGIEAGGQARLDFLESFIKAPKAVQLKETLSQVGSNFTKPDYLTAVNQVRAYIKSGDIYQANMTQRFSAPIKESPFELFEKLRTINPAPFASYLDFGQGHIVSSSPERFIKIQNGLIETRPIKGTRPRCGDEAVDLVQRTELLNSEKDKSELLMIVDLERNDLSKIAKTGTVKVTELFKLETYATVYHLVSTVQAQVADEYSVVDCIKATFPGGSITGAPKIRAMEVIDELEPTARGVYTGSIGYIDLNGNTDLNIVIRTFICKNGQAYFQAGGGIVWDSDAASEYQETLDKAFALKKALNYKES